MADTKRQEGKDRERAMAEVERIYWWGSKASKNLFADALLEARAEEAERAKTYRHDAINMDIRAAELRSQKSHG